MPDSHVDNVMEEPGGINGMADYENDISIQLEMRNPSSNERIDLVNIE